MGMTGQTQQNKVSCRPTKTNSMTVNASNRGKLGPFTDSWRTMEVFHAKIDLLSALSAVADSWLPSSSASIASLCATITASAAQNRPLPTHETGWVCARTNHDRQATTQQNPYKFYHYA
ncbi:MAG: hypothetical protein H7836_03535 [Magnetococcus sp. YQC-3]